MAPSDYPTIIPDQYQYSSIAPTSNVTVETSCPALKNDTPPFHPPPPANVTTFTCDQGPPRSHSPRSHHPSSSPSEYLNSKPSKSPSFDHPTQAPTPHASAPNPIAVPSVSPSSISRLGASSAPLRSPSHAPHLSVHSTGMPSTTRPSETSAKVVVPTRETSVSPSSISRLGSSSAPFRSPSHAPHLSVHSTGVPSTTRPSRTSAKVVVPTRETSAPTSSPFALLAPVVVRSTKSPTEDLQPSPSSASSFLPVMQSIEPSSVPTTNTAVTMNPSIKPISAVCKKCAQECYDKTHKSCCNLKKTQKCVRKKVKSCKFTQGSVGKKEKKSVLAKLKKNCGKPKKKKKRSRH